jgi:hypothetical protein
MKAILLSFLALGLVLPVAAETKLGKPRKSLLENDPEVVDLTQTVKTPIVLTVIKEAPVFSDKGGKSRIGFLKAGQAVPLEAMTEKAYKVRGKGTKYDISGWVAPSAFSSKDPEFVTHLKQLYERQIAVQQLIAAKEIAIGMTLEEVGLARGKPNKTTTRKTAKGESGSWEYVEYKTINHYTTQIDPRTGLAYRQFAYSTQEEKDKTVVEFTDGLVSSIEETEDRKGGNVRIVVPPVVFGW